jgi:putative membrane protein
MGMGVGWLVMLAFWGLLGLGVFYLLRPSDRTTGESAEQVLRRRFAAGEIDRQQYEEMGRVLRDEPSRAA